MSLPERPGGSPLYDQRNTYRNSPSRRQRPNDVEAGGYHSASRAGEHQRGKSASSFAETISNPNANTESVPLSPTDLHGNARENNPDQTFGRKRSLIRPERNRIGKDHRNYHYHRHAANMDVLPSSTGNDPILENFDASTERSGGSQALGSLTSSPPHESNKSRTVSGDQEKDDTRVKTRPARNKSGKITKESKGARVAARKSKNKVKLPEDQLRPPSFWNVYCAIVTFWCPDFMLRCCGKPTKSQRRAWREKMGPN